MRFTIRDVVWLTALVATGAAWAVDRMWLFERLTEAERVCEVVDFLDVKYPDWREETLGYLQEERMLSPADKKASVDER
jgi:hypothetical protein